VASSTLIDNKTKAILQYTEKTTRTPHKLTQTDMEGLRAIGCTDAEILEAVSVIAFFNLMVRLADALGAPVQDFQQRMEERM
jgi:uncharacterized peroxidase-related enzyme